MKLLTIFSASVALVLAGCGYQPASTPELRAVSKCMNGDAARYETCTRPYLERVR